MAQLHIDSGWVPRVTRVSELEAGVRAVCEPIFEKPLSEISFGAVLLQLFQVARRFEMEVQPQLVLLQKTLLNIEGLGRQLYPDLDLWATGKPFLKRWVVKRNNPQTLIKRFVDQAPAILKVMPDMPMLLHDYLALQNQTARQSATEAGGRRQPGIHSVQKMGKAMRYSITGGALLLSSALLGAAFIISEQVGIPWWIWVMAAAGLAYLITGLRRA